jgi:hypothetical protein
MCVVFMCMVVCGVYGLGRVCLWMCVMSVVCGVDGVCLWLCVEWVRDECSVWCSVMCVCVGSGV